MSYWRDIATTALMLAGLTVLLALTPAGCASPPAPQGGLERLPGPDSTFGPTMSDWQRREAQP